MTTLTGIVNVTLMHGVNVSIFSTKNIKGEIPNNCKEVIKKYLEDGMFEIDKIFDGQSTTFYFLLTQDCNGKCEYCYQPKEFRQPIKMSKQVVDDSLNFIFDNFKEEKIKFSLFGGEPTLNMEMVKYMVESYPQFPFVITTNGILMKESEEIRNWMKNQHNLNISVSINALKPIYGKEKFLSYIKPVLEAIKHNGGDVHYVIDNPDDVNIINEVKFLFDYGIQVRISSARHWDLVKEKSESFISLFKDIANYIYFDREKPLIGRCPWDTAFKGNIYNYYKGNELKSTPPTFCGCGYLYLAINYKGDIYPCDFFANFPEFCLGSVYDSINSNSLLFRGMKDWMDNLYEDCKNCTVCENGDIRLCPRAMCLAENYVVSGNPLKPAPNHCHAEKIEYELFSYISKRGIAEGLDKYFSRK